MAILKERITINLQFIIQPPFTYEPVMVWLGHRELLFLTFPGTSILLSIVTGLIYIATPSRATFLSYISTTLLPSQFKKIRQPNWRATKVWDTVFSTKFKKRILIKAFNSLTYLSIVI